MINRGILFHIVLIVGIGSIAYFLPSKSNGVEVTVLIKDTGFEPESMIIEKGTKVIFKNIGEQPHWPASNFHPTHTLYPESGGCLGSKFDACKALGSGEEYSFIFNKLGSWPAHDHIYPGLTMVITVEDKNSLEADKTNSNTAEFRLWDYQKQMQAIKKMARDDPAKAWQFLKSSFVVNGQVMGNVHEFAHIIGNEIYSQQGLDGIRICDDTFAFGCFHGVTEQLLNKEGISVIKEVQRRCLEIYSPGQSQNYTGCIHGTGHGLFTLEGLDVKRALMDCNIFDEQYRGYCYDGVFMENSTTYPQSVVLDRTWSFCESLDEKYGYNCARYMTTSLFKKYSDTASVAEECGKTEKEIFYRTCYETVGYYIGQSNQGNFEKIKIECFTIKDQGALEGCIVGAAVETIFQEYQSWDKVSTDLCSLLPAQKNSSCLMRLSQTRRNYNR